MDPYPQTIRIATNYVGEKPKELDLKCRSVEWVEERYHDMTGADGAVLRSILEGPRIIASGLSSDFDEDAGWNRVIHSLYGAHDIADIRRSGDEVELVLHYRAPAGSAGRGSRAS